MAPRDLMIALDLDPSVLDLVKFDPDQPPRAGGNGLESGQWAGETHSANREILPNLLIPVATTENFPYGCKVLGIDPIALRMRCTRQHFARIGAAENCTFDLNNGDIFYNGEHIGNLGD